MLLRSYKFVAVILILIAIVLVVIKITFWDYAFQRFLPKTKYNVSYNYSFEGFNDPVFISTFLPFSDQRQTITEELNNSPAMKFLIESTANGHVGRWETPAANGNTNVSFSFEYFGTATQYLIDTALLIPVMYSNLLDEYRAPSEHIQANHPQIREIYDEIAGEEQHIEKVLRAVQAYSGSLNPMPFKGVTDALTAVRLGEASCNGMSRLFVALARTGNIPSVSLLRDER